MNRFLPTRRRKPSRDEGFSLIEVMVAMTFLGIGLLAVAQMVPLGMAGVTQARVRTNAVQAAQEKLEDLRAEPFSSPSLTPGVYTEANGNYTLDWSIADDTPVPGSKRVLLTASWQHFSGTKNVRLTTYVTDRD